MNKYGLSAVAFAGCIAAIASAAACGSGNTTAGGAPDAGGHDATAGDANGAADAPNAPDTASGADAGSDGSTLADAGADAGAAADTGSDASDAGTGDGAIVAEAGADAGVGPDPQPTSCDGGGVPPVVGGTPECPSDKNLPGCACSSSGTSAACWTGLRAQRGHGDCKDGTTSCEASDAGLAWGACNGEVLPTDAGTAKASCLCFSTGQWAVANTEPCFLTVTDGSGNMTTVAYASTPGNPVTCPFNTTTGQPTVPATWSTDTLTVDCTGFYTLCYALKAGDPTNPQATDCVLATTCTGGAHYDTAGVAQTFPPLPGWQTTASQDACVTQFLATGGYAVMSVSGQSDECQTVAENFQSVTYCASSATNCTAGGGGPF